MYPDIQFLENYEQMRCIDVMNKRSFSTSTPYHAMSMKTNKPIRTNQYPSSVLDPHSLLHQIIYKASLQSLHTGS